MKLTRFIKCIGSLGFCLFLAAHSFVVAESLPSEAAVPVKHASFHQLVFADEDIAILNNLYPPRGDSGFHTHYRGLFAVVIEASPSSGQALGKPLTPAAAYSAGTAAYSAVGAEPRTHRVVNGDKGVRVVVRGGLLTTIVSGLQDQQLALRPGDFAVQPAGATRALKNSGTETIELVEIALK